jgi:hypothetical protein
VLRAAVITGGAILAGSGLLLVTRGVHMPGWQLLVVGLVVLLGTLFERWRYHQSETPADGPWQKTSERFIDPATGEPMDVLFNPRTGERRYVSGAKR